MASKQEWQGRVGRAWADETDALDRLLGPAGQAAIETLAGLRPLAGLGVLDLGCGQGLSTERLAQRGAKPEGVDVSEALITAARKRFDHKFHLADAAGATFTTQFDAIFSQFGMMFFDHPTAAFAHLRAGLVPQGLFVGAAWDRLDRNAWAAEPLLACADLIGLDQLSEPPVGAPGPFGWADPDYVSRLLETAGWSAVSVQAVTYEAAVGRAGVADPITEAADLGLRIGPLASRLRGRSDKTKAQAHARLCDLYSDKLRDGNVWIGAQALVYKAQADAT